MKKIKVQRFISVTLTVVMMFGLFAGVTRAANDVPTLDEWIANTYNATDTTSSDLTPRYGSNGKFLAPIEPPVAGSIAISTRAELEAIKDNLSGNYHLVNDIDLDDAEWVPIGDGSTLSEDSRFMGIFDGQGYVIRNLTIGAAENPKDIQYAGLFGYVYNAIIKNVGLEEMYINISNSAYAYAGGICGYGNYISNCYSTGDVSTSSYYSSNAGGICGYGISISNCYNVGNVSASSASANAYAGGICGGGDDTIRNCYNTGDVYAHSSFNAYAGGISGFGSDRIIIDCYNSGNISASSSSSHAYAGGIRGYVHNTTISNCYNTGDISTFAFFSHAGGICGFGYYISLNIINCYNTGAVSASSAFTSSASYAYAGGICGYNNGTIINCYNAGAVSASSYYYNSYAGGICGFGYTISNCYWNSDNKQMVNDIILENASKKGIGDGTDDNTTPLTTAQMQTQSSFAGFDFDNVWDIDPAVNNGYPYLRDMPIGGGNNSDEIFTKNGSFTYSAGHIDKNVVAGGEKGNYTTDYYYSDSFFEDTSYSYRQDLSSMSLCLAMAAFGKYGGPYSEKDETIVSLLEDIGFDKNNIDTTLGYGEEPTVDSIGAAIALKPLPATDGKDTVLLTVAVRGGEYKSEWGNNFYLGNQEVHQGFSDSRYKVTNAISAFLDEHGDELSGKRVKLWIVGYSRGSAVANLLGAFFNDLADEENGQIRDFYLSSEDIYTYGFAVPAVTREDGTDSELHKNIFSIVSANDFVTRFAPSVKGHSLTSKWEYKRYGVTLSIPTAETLGANRYAAFENAMLHQFTKFDKSSTAKFTEADYLIDDFAKHLGFIKLSPPYIGIGAKLRYQLPQSIWLDDLINIAAIEIFYSPAVYVNVFQTIIMDAMVDFGRGNDINVDGIIDELLWYIIFLAVSDINQYSDYAATLMANASTLMQAHYPEIYLAWMNSFLTDPDLCAEWLNSINLEKYRIVHINCPVDIEVYDSDNNLAAKIVNDIPQEITDSSIYAGLDENGQKTIYLPAGEEYTIKINATDNSEMTYSVQEFDRNEGNITRVVNYYEVAIEKGDTLTGIVENLTEEDNGNYILFGDNNEEIEPSEVFSNIDEIENYEVNVEIVGNGNVTGEGIRIKGEFAMLTAYPAEREQFLGWYKDGEVISSEISYRFCVLSDTTFEARFKKTTIIKGDLNGDGVADIDDARLFLEYLVGNKNLTDDEEAALRFAVPDYDNSEISAIKKLRQFLNTMTKQEE